VHKRWRPQRVFLYRQPVDMRKAIDGLSTLVMEQLDRDPSDHSMYVFISTDRRKIKCLLWERNGFWLLYKRLESQRFAWPGWFEDESMALDAEQLGRLLDGVDLNALRPHHALTFSHLA
jgi:transposase